MDSAGEWWFTRTRSLVGTRSVNATVPRLLGVAGGGHGKRGSGGRDELINEFGYDTKYAMHCARLGFQCLELLSTGKLDLPIQGEPAEWLRAVRYGKVDFDEWWNRSLELDAQLEAIGDDESIRPTPDREKIDAWCINAHQRIWAVEALG